MRRYLFIYLCPSYPFPYKFGTFCFSKQLLFIRIFRIIIQHGQLEKATTDALKNIALIWVIFMLLIRIIKDNQGDFDMNKVKL